MLAQPPHTTHRLTTFGCWLFQPLQSYYDQFIERWLRNHPGRRTFTEYQIAEHLPTHTAKQQRLLLQQTRFVNSGFDRLMQTFSKTTNTRHQ